MTGLTTAWWAPWALCPQQGPIRSALLVVTDGRITELRGGVPVDALDDPGIAPADTSVFLDCVIAPGFVNAHSHLEYAIFDGLADGVGFASWIGSFLEHAKRLEEDDIAASALLGALESVAGGITCTGDATFALAAADAMVRTGMRGVAYVELFCRSADDQVVATTVDAAIARLDGTALGARIRGGLSPHAPYTVSPAAFDAVANTGLPWMTHLAESLDESRYALDGTGALVDQQRARGTEPAAWGGWPLERLAGAFSPRSVIVHAVNAHVADLDALAQSGAGIAHCPRSNARLGCGRLDLAACDDAGVIVGLGTDSPASAGPFDMFDHMRFTIDVHRAAGVDIDAARVLRMATCDSARVLDIGGVGTLEVGSHADIFAVAVGETSQPLDALVWRGHPQEVLTTMIGGEIAFQRTGASTTLGDLAAARECGAAIRRRIEQEAVAGPTR